MALLALMISAGTLGLVGGLHCTAMCTGLQRLAVHGLSAPNQTIVWTPPPSRSSPRRNDWSFHIARMLSYAALGAAAGTGSWLLRWGAGALPVMRPLWSALNLLVLFIGLTLLLHGRQPDWLNALGQAVGRQSQARLDALNRWHRLRPWVAGIAWGLLPCGLLYSAVALAALASEPGRGALVMLVFALGTTIHLLGAQHIIALMAQHNRFQSRIKTERLGTRLSGAALAILAALALVALARGQPHPFCMP
jgi:sulfite exporter TauE/SafE